MRAAFAFVLAAAPLAGLAPAPAPPMHAPAPVRWGEDGHRIVGRAAADALPEAMPVFFRDAAAQLSYLNPEPDRWRDRAERDLDAAMDGAHAPEHFVDMELLPLGALLAPNRLAYADSLRAAGESVAVAGILPYTILELTQRLRVSFRLWRATEDDADREWIEARILNDAGILGHYVADGSNPHHTTIHYNGWVGENPEGFTTERGFHGRFESAYVASHVTLDEVARAATAPPRDLGPLRAAIWNYLAYTHLLVPELYRLDQTEPFGESTTGAAHRAFAVERLADGATMLRDLWWTAWVTSAPEAEGE